MTEAQLVQVMPHVSQLRLATHAPFLLASMQEFDVSTPLRQAAFVAQLAHECGELRWLEEIWGPTEQQKKYERPEGAPLIGGDPRLWPLWQKLGNLQPGDGHRYRGRGAFQLTGRANYARAGGELGVDLVGTPDLAATMELVFRIAGLYWRDHHLNALADSEDFVGITRAINGGVRGLADRETYYARARAALGLPSWSQETAA